MNCKEYKKTIMSPMNIIITVLLLMIICLFLILVFPNKIVVASADSGREKVVTTLQIKSGDTFWSIAGKYITEEYSDRSDYVKEIKKSNGITSDLLYEGQYIIVPHYVES